ncbi:hypothetical protein LOK49_LG05G03424 [Camellia lanceoleosa]|uniref:Uncharacterized protein n=1 Tax=Camellia lanceoleosa TaxID=1840588 RepID=A0ACC0HQ57_9ERIC|nr:hypothetical protein LOK49_LG05G03424 [Camellia lanceoleosa]
MLINPFEITVLYVGCNFINLYAHDKALLLIFAGECESTGLYFNTYSTRNNYYCSKNGCIISYIRHNLAEGFCCYGARVSGKYSDERRVIKIGGILVATPPISSEDSTHLLLIVAKMAQEVNIILETHVVDQLSIHCFVWIDMANPKSRGVAGSLVNWSFKAVFVLSSVFAVVMIADRMATGLQSWWMAFSNAVTPATWGVTIDVLEMNP